MFTTSIGKFALRSVVGTFGLGLASCAFAQSCGQRWESEASVPGVVEAVRDIERLADGDVIVAGSIRFAGLRRVGNIARFDRETGTWDPMGFGTDGTVNELARLPDGRVLAAGFFSLFNGQSASLMLYDGTRWDPVTTPLEQVSQVAVAPDGLVWIVGTDARTRESGVWRGDLTTWTRLADPFGILRISPTGEVYSFVPFDPSVTSSVNKLVGSEWLPVGQVSPPDLSPLNFFVSGMTITADGELLISGWNLLATSQPFGQTPVTTARWTGEEWVPVRTIAAHALGSPSDYVTRWFGGALIIGSTGAAVYENGTLRSIELSFSSLGSAFTSVADGPDAMLLGGVTVRTPDGDALGVARVSGDVAQPLSPASLFNVQPSTATRTLDDEVLAFGGFSRVGEHPAQRLARWEGGVWSAVPVDLSAYSSAFISASGLVIAEMPAPDNEIAVWNGQQLLPQVPGSLRPVAETRLPDGTWLYAGFRMSSVPARPQYGLFVWDGTQMRERFRAVRRAVSVAARSDGDIYALGALAAPLQDRRLLRIRNDVVTDVSASVSGGLGSLPGPWMLHQGDTTLLAVIRQASTSQRLEFLRFDGDDWVPAFAPLLNRTIRAHAMREDGTPMLVVADSSSSVLRTELVTWNSACDCWRVATDVPQSRSGAVNALVALPGGDALAFGSFVETSKIAAYGVARWREGERCCDSLDFTQDGTLDDRDIAELFSVFAGGICPTFYPCDIDFNNDGIWPADDDITAYLHVLAGGECP